MAATNRYGTMLVAAAIVEMAESAIKRHLADGEWRFGQKPPHHFAMALP